MGKARWILALLIAIGLTVYGWACILIPGRKHFAGRCWMPLSLTGGTLQRHTGQTLDGFLISCIALFVMKIHS
jgi:hypothetical protein